MVAVSTARPRCKFIKTVLASNAAKRAEDEDEEPIGGYIRGEGYYNEEEGDGQC